MISPTAPERLPAATLLESQRALQPAVHICGYVVKLLFKRGYTTSAHYDWSSIVGAIERILGLPSPLPASPVPLPSP